MMDFWEVETISFPADGSNITPAHHYSEFRFKIYAPIAFRYFRDLFGIQPDDFMVSFSILLIICLFWLVTKTVILSKVKKNIFGFVFRYVLRPAINDAIFEDVLAPETVFLLAPFIGNIFEVPLFFNLLFRLFTYGSSTKNNKNNVRSNGIYKIKYR